MTLLQAANLLYQKAKPVEGQDENGFRINGWLVTDEIFDIFEKALPEDHANHKPDLEQKEKNMMTLNEAIRLLNKTSARQIDITLDVQVRRPSGFKPEPPLYQIWDGHKFHEGNSLDNAVASFLKDNPIPGSEPASQDPTPIFAEASALNAA